MDPVVFDGFGRMGHPRRSIPETLLRRSSKNMFDYARCGTRQGAYIEKLAQEAKFAAALPLTHEGDLLGRFEGTRGTDGDLSIHSKDDGFADDPKNPMGRATRAVAAMPRAAVAALSRGARRKAYCKTAVSTGSTTEPIARATPLMLAARSGNVALVKNNSSIVAPTKISKVDDYDGTTAWMGALNRADRRSRLRQGASRRALRKRAWARILSDVHAGRATSAGWSAVRASFGCWV